MKFGLIGTTLKHSFSKQYFEEKFKVEKLNHIYDLIEFDNLDNIKKYLIENNYFGLNVTIPYKEEILKHLDFISNEAKIIGAVNTLKIENTKIKGYNTDYFGFQTSLLNFIPHNKIKALIFGTGGASKAVEQALIDLNIDYKKVTRSAKNDVLSYEDLNKEIINQHKLLINTTPLGTYPNVGECVNINYNFVSENHYCYDLVYNPEITLFMKNCKKNGAKFKNGLEMLHLQAEKSWEIWNS